MRKRLTLTELRRRVNRRLWMQRYERAMDVLGGKDDSRALGRIFEDYAYRAPLRVYNKDVGFCVLRSLGERVDIAMCDSREVAHYPLTSILIKPREFWAGVCGGIWRDAPRASMTQDQRVMLLDGARHRLKLDVAVMLVRFREKLTKQQRESFPYRWTFTLPVGCACAIVSIGGIVSVEYAVSNGKKIAVEEIASGLDTIEKQEKAVRVLEAALDCFRREFDIRESSRRPEQSPAAP